LTGLGKAGPTAIITERKYRHFWHGNQGNPGEGIPESGRSLRQGNPGIRLVFAGDPQRGIPPCAACHGPGAQKLGAPPLRGQHPEYIERQLGAFAQGMRQNDINEQMRVIAHELTPGEMHMLAVYYGAGP
jgi:cytochrome c553